MNSGSSIASQVQRCQLRFKAQSGVLFNACIASAFLQKALEEGAKVAITGKNPATIEKARQELGSDVLVIASDASLAGDQKLLTHEIHRAFGQPDILFVLRD